MGLTKQFREILDQLIDDKIKEVREYKLPAYMFKQLIGDEHDFVLGFIIGEIYDLFNNLFISINKRNMSEEEIMEVYHIIRSRVPEIKNAF